MRPLVQVLTVTYNHAPYIRQTIESIINQKTDFPYQLLIHDDASTDGTTEIVREYAQKYPDKIYAIFQTENQYSQGKDVFDFFTPYLNGKYIAQCDGDDYWCDEHKLQKQADYMEAHPECELCVHNSYDLDAEGKRIGKHCVSEEDGIIETERVLLEGGHFCVTSSTLWRTKSWLKYPADWTFGQVGDLPLRYYLVTLGYVYCFSDYMSCYRICVPGSWTDRTKLARKYKTQTVIKEQEMFLDFLETYDQLTQRRFHDTIMDSFIYEKAVLLLLKRQLPEVKKAPYNTYYKRLPLKIRIIEHIDFYTPWALSLYRKLKYKIFKEEHSAE